MTGGNTNHYTTADLFFCNVTVQILSDVCCVTMNAKSVELLPLEAALMWMRGVIDLRKLRGRELNPGLPRDRRKY